MPNRRVALVTGGNRGIGLEICRQLASKGGIRVVLTARDADKGAAAMQSLRDLGLDVSFFKFDVADELALGGLTPYLLQEFGRLDILVNNAGVFSSDDRSKSPLEIPSATVRSTLETNTLAPLRLIQALVPLMRRNSYGRIVNLSSQLGQLATMASGYPAYRLSKTALNAVTCMVAAELKGTGILVNSMCPGWVKTDMGGEQAPRTVEQGADTAVWLATLPDDGPTGGFFTDRQPMAW